jgi:pimeloyl-ACP methyl ester carboxylesterase
MELAFQLWPSQSRQAATKLVLLHGMGGTGALWRPVAASLENHYTMMAFDQRGHGQSRVSTPSGGRDAHAEGYTPLDYGRDVIETLEKQDFHPAWLIGHSMGVRTACAAAHLKPEWIQGMILIDLGFSGPVGEGLGDGLGNFLRKLPTSFASRESARQFMTEHCPDPAIAQYLMAVSVTRDGVLTFPFEHAALIQTIEAARLVSVRTWVRALGVRGMPILVLRGAQSLVWTREQFEEERELLREFPSIVFREFEGAGHGLPFEQRVRFVKEVDEFIRGRSSGDRT